MLTSVFSFLGLSTSLAQLQLRQNDDSMIWHCRAVEFLFAISTRPFDVIVGSAISSPTDPDSAYMKNAHRCSQDHALAHADVGGNL